MATVTDITSLLHNLQGITVEEPSNDVFPISYRDHTFHLPVSEIEQYLERRDTIDTSPETSLFLPRYYEHLVDIQAAGPGPRQLFGLNEGTIAIQAPDSSLSAELSNISTIFLLTILDRELNPSLRRRMRVGMRRYLPQGEGTENETRIQDMFYTMYTIKVIAHELYQGSTAKSKLRHIAEAALFNVSFSRGVGLSLSHSWERSYYRLGRRRQSEIQFPQRSYNSDLVAYYNLALASESLILAYLSFYKILEYFYLSAAETVLHRRLRDKMALPDFNNRNSMQLRQLVTLVRKFDQRMDEQKMLANVISLYFMPDEVESWLQESPERESYYTSSVEVFGETVRLDLNPDQFAASLARRIYHIRNTLVHNKEGELPRFIPFSGQEEVLYKELPILLFLSEMLIVKTGEDL